MPHSRVSVTRRDLLRGTVGATLGASIMGIHWVKAGAPAAGSSLVTVVRDKHAVDTVGVRVIMEKRKAIRKEPWPVSPPPLCVEAADKVYGLGTSDWSRIKVEPWGWDEGLLLG